MACSYLDNPRLVLSRIRDALFTSYFKIRNTIAKYFGEKAGRFVFELIKLLKNTKNGILFDDTRWIYNTYDWWMKELDCKRDKFRRIIKALTEFGIIAKNKWPHPTRKNKHGFPINVNYYSLHPKLYTSEGEIDLLTGEDIDLQVGGSNADFQQLQDISNTSVTGIDNNSSIYIKEENKEVLQEVRLEPTKAPIVSNLEANDGYLAQTRSIEEEETNSIMLKIFGNMRI